MRIALYSDLHRECATSEFQLWEPPIRVLGIEDIYEPFTPRLVAVLMVSIGALPPDVSRAMAGEIE